MSTAQIRYFRSHTYSTTASRNRSLNQYKYTYARAFGMNVIITRVDQQHGFPTQIRFPTGKVFNVCRARFQLFLYIKNAFFFVLFCSPNTRSTSFIALKTQTPVPRIRDLIERVLVL